MERLIVVMCICVVLSAGSSAMADRCSGIASPVFCDDFDRWCDPEPDPGEACICGTDAPNQAGFEAFWIDEGCGPEPLWPAPDYASSQHTLEGDGSWKCDPPDLTEGYGAHVHHRLDSTSIVRVRRHTHELPSAVNGAGDIDAFYLWPNTDVNTAYVDSMDRTLRPDSLKGQFFVYAGTCGHYGYLNAYVELYLDDDRAPTDYLRTDCQWQHDARRNAIDCACKNPVDGKPVPCSGSCVGNVCSNTGAACTQASDCSFCVDGTCTNTGRLCNNDVDCTACVYGPLEGMACVEDAECRHGPFWQRIPLEGDGVRHNSIAIGFVAVVDGDPCFDGTNEWAPAEWRLAIFDGLNWQTFKAPALDIPMTPGDIEGDNWDLRPTDGWNLIEYAIGAEYIEVRLRNQRSEAYHAGGACVTRCGQKKCFGGPGHGEPCNVDSDCPKIHIVDCRYNPVEMENTCWGGRLHEMPCETAAECPTSPALPNPYFIARVPRQDDPELDSIYGPFNKIAIGPGKGVDLGTPTCVDFGVVEPYKRCVGGDNDGGVCNDDGDCTSASDNCIEVGLGQNPGLIDEVVLYDGDVDPVGGACCRDGTFICEDDVEEVNCLPPDVWHSGQECIADAILCCPDPFADADNDGDVDLGDFGRWQVCFSGDGNAHPDTRECKCFNRDGGTPGDVDETDFIDFTNCWSGPTVPAVPTCDD